MRVVAIHEAQVKLTVNFEGWMAGKFIDQKNVRLICYFERCEVERSAIQHK